MELRRCPHAYQKGDNVKVIAGKDKGKEGKVIATEPKDRVVVEGVNVIKNTKTNSIKS